MFLVLHVLGCGFRIVESRLEGMKGATLSHQEEEAGRKAQHQENAGYRRKMTSSWWSKEDEENGSFGKMQP